jgi:lipid-A-disaccharide synthase
MKIAQRLNEIGIKVQYYVAPQAWAWKEYRVKKLARDAHTLYTIIPFEKEWFGSRGVKKIIGIEHPQLTHHKESLSNFSRKNFNSKEVKILLLPGSRNFEVGNLLPDFIEAIKDLKKSLNVKVSIVKSSSVDAKLYTNYDNYFDRIFTNEKLVEAIEEADFAIAASGTVTLTCALYELPTVVCYKSSLLNYFIYETFVPYKGPISLANIVHNRSVFPELIQDNVTPFNIATNIKKWYNHKDDYLELRSKLAMTKELVKGEEIKVANYISNIINESYGRN